MITGKNIRQILCIALKSKVLIVTKTDDNAREIRHEIADFVLGYVSSDLNVRVYTEGVKIGALDPILVFSLKKWNDSKRAYPFGGVVIVTDENISDIKNIAVGTKKVLLHLHLKRSEKNV